MGWLAESGRVEFDRDRAPLRLLGVSQDITDRKEAELESARLAAVVVAAPSAVVALDQSSRIVAWNPSAERLFGYSADKAIGQHISIIAPDERRDEQNSVLERVLTGKLVQIETQRRHEIGRLVDVQIDGSPILDSSGAVVGQSYVLQDITERKRADEALRESEQRLAATYLHAPIGIVETTLEGRYAKVNDAFCRITGYSEEELGRCFISDLTHPADWPHNFEMFQRLLAGEMPSIKIEKRYIRKDGSTVWCEVTRALVRGPQGDPRYVIGAVVDISARKEAEELLRRREADLTRAQRMALIGGFEVVRRDGAFVGSRSPEYLAIHGLPSDATIESHDAWATRLHPADREPVTAAFDAAIIGDAMEYQNEYRIVRQNDNAVRWIHVAAEINRDESGQVTGIFGTHCDITERKVAEEHQQLLMREVNHRAKNMLGLIQAIAWQTAATQPEDFLARFGQRVQALAASQDLLVRNEWKAVPLKDLVQSQLAHLGDPRVSLDGPQIEITASAAQALGMALHELATNAAKYGALSNERGRVRVSWGIKLDAESGSQFTMSWVESGGPRVAKPSRLGFGSTVIDAMVRMSLRCEPRLEFAPAGFVWRIECPVEKVIEGKSEQADARSKGSSVIAPVAQERKRRRVLIVEDEALLAIEIAKSISGAQWEVVGPASTVALAMAMLAVEGCDAAVLDTKLGDETSEPVAAELIRSGTPFIVVSGLSREQQPPLLQQALVIGKPLQHERLVAELGKCLDGR